MQKWWKRGAAHPPLFTRDLCSPDTFIYLGALASQFVTELHIWASMYCLAPS